MRASKNLAKNFVLVCGTMAMALTIIVVSVVTASSKRPGA